MTLTVDIKKDYALSILENLEKIGAINIMDTKKLENEEGKNKTYQAVRINLKGFKFNREDANER